MSFFKSRKSGETPTGDRVVAGLAAGLAGSLMGLGIAADANKLENQMADMRPETEIVREIEAADLGFDWNAAGELRDRGVDVADGVAETLSKRREQREAMDRPSESPGIGPDPPDDGMSNRSFTSDDGRFTISVDEDDRYSVTLNEREEDMLSESSEGMEARDSLDAREEASLESGSWIGNSRGLSEEEEESLMDSPGSFRSEGLGQGMDMGQEQGFGQTM